MSDTNNFETGYQDDNDNTVAPNNTGSNNASTGFGTPTTKGKGDGKKGSKLPLIIFGVLAITGIGAGAYFMLGGDPAPAPRPAPVATADQQADVQDPATADIDGDGLADGASGVNGMGDMDGVGDQDVQIDPITGLPVTDPALAGSPEIDPITGLPVAEATQPVAGDEFNIDPSTIATADSAAQDIDPITGLPIASSQDPADLSPDPMQGQVDPITGLPVQATQADPIQQHDPDFPPVQQPAPSVAQQPSQPQQMSNDPLAQFRDMLAPIDGRVTVLEGQVSTLTTRVDEIGNQVNRLMDRPRNSNSIDVSKAPKPAPRRAARKAPAKPKQDNYVRMADAPSPRVEPPVSRVVIVTQGSAAHQEMVRKGEAPAHATTSSFRTVASSGSTAPSQVRDVPAASAPEAAVVSPSCNLQAIVPGRVWVKNADGSFASYGEGDTWNGKTVGTIDPSRGVKIGDSWVCN